MDSEKIHLTATGLFFIIAFFIMLSFVSSIVGESRISAMAVSNDDVCDDGTLPYKCSEISPGNACTLTKTGLELRFSDKCYE